MGSRYITKSTFLSWDKDDIISPVLTKSVKNVIELQCRACLQVPSIPPRLFHLFIDSQLVSILMCLCLYLIFYQLSWRSKSIVISKLQTQQTNMWPSRYLQLLNILIWLNVCFFLASDVSLKSISLFTFLEDTQNQNPISACSKPATIYMFIFLGQDNFSKEILCATKHWCYTALGLMSHTRYVCLVVQFSVSVA